jgi:hypothetical protein
MMQLERVRWRGIPIDMALFRRAKQHAPAIAAKMRSEMNGKLGTEVYFCGVFKFQFQSIRRLGTIAAPRGCSNL